MSQRQHQQRRKSRKSKKTPMIIIIAIVAVVAVGLGSLAVVAFTGGENSGGKPGLIPAAEEDLAKASAKAEEEVAAVAAARPYVDSSIDPSYYRVINRTYPIEPGYVAGTGELTDIEGKQMETNAAAALKEMIAAMRAEGMEVVVQSGYRSDSDQEFLYNRQIERQEGNKEKAATISAVPLTSEHQAGLAVDLSDDGTLIEQFGSTEQGIWLKAHCAEYGFILRYLPEKTEYTGIISEPWHFRFVGSPDMAKAITDSGLCMEEYFEQYLAPEDLDPYKPYLDEIAK
jgi:LAS superfamily LD-carboxypeptidase LdcB